MVTESLYALSAAQSVLEVTLGSFDFHRMAHSSRAAASVAEFPDGSRVETREEFTSKPHSVIFLTISLLLSPVLASHHLSGSSLCLSLLPVVLSASLVSSQFRSKAGNSSLSFEQNGFPSSPCKFHSQGHTQSPRNSTRFSLKRHAFPKKNSSNNYSGKD